MINLFVDEGYAFDYLSILHLKYSLDSINDTKRIAFESCKESLEDQLGNKFDEVFNSKEYKTLYVTNAVTFNAVEDAKTDKIKASKVDELNYKRFVAKKAIHEKFFGGVMHETKVGYEVYDT